MAEAGAWAYPVLMLAMIGVARAGRREAWGEFEWMRLGALALLTGLVVAVQVKLIMIGVASAPLAVLCGAVSLVGLAGLLGLYLWERWQSRQLPRLTAVITA